MTNLDPKHLDELVAELRIHGWKMNMRWPDMAADAITALRAQLDQAQQDLNAEEMRGNAERQELRTHIDRERAATIEAAAKACEACAPDPAGGAASHTNSMRVIAFDCRNKVAKLHTDATRAAMDAIRREGYEAGVRKERAKSDELANAARGLADCCQLGEDADWEEGEDPLSALRAILAARS